MTSRPSFARILCLVLAGALAGCGGEAAPGPGADDWRAMLAAGDGAGAEAALRRELDGGAAPAMLAPWLGEAELQQGNLPEAEFWLTGGEFAPEASAHGFHMLGRLRMKQGDLPAAGKAFDRALASDPDDPELWVDIGRLRWLGGEQVQAREAAARALEQGPANPAALLFRAQLVRDSHGNVAALPLLERSLEVAANDPELLAEYAATLGEVGRARDMVAATRRLSTAAPGDRRVPYLQAILAARAGKDDLARSLLQRSGDIDRKLPAAMLLLALLDIENGNFASAAQGLDVLSRRQPDNPRVRHLLAKALALGGNHRELVARFGERATTPYLATLVGRSYEALGEREKAAPYLDTAASGGALRIAAIADRAGAGTAPVVGEVRRYLGNGNVNAARKKANALLAANPGSSDAVALAGDVALAAGDAREAVRLYGQAATVRRSWSLVQRMAVALDRSGRRDAATDLIAEHLAGEPANADAAAVLARRLKDRGDRSRATLLLRYAQTRGRNDPLFDRLLEG
ncbi:tetratricopeptide repeat protein [Tsuneonella dongtanensis]|uniref:Tetratricopeptide repeat protein n=1 Tax=Tsuneonella dongtanensis TaxID=692370 RepID=A0A1B2AEK6_9SPHN|nr:tetratricopeptide repeat protein [Tsuneonella dongtanensis]ANY20566.1 tetratricopeptide repeat protein [Tsuneonella dongtanensis]